MITLVYSLTDRPHTRVIQHRRWYCRCFSPSRQVRKCLIWLSTLVADSWHKVRTSGHSCRLLVRSFNCALNWRTNFPPQGLMVTATIKGPSFSRLTSFTDDGSGSVTILESFRALLVGDYHPIRAVEFHWYSAEVRPHFHVNLIHCLLNVTYTGSWSPWIAGRCQRLWIPVCQCHRYEPGLIDLPSSLTLILTPLSSIWRHGSRLVSSDDVYLPNWIFIREEPAKKSGL